jgi:hypothetical protein
MCLIAGREGLQGLLPDTPQLAWTLRMDTDDLAMDLNQLASTGMVERTPGGWLVVHFAKRQAPSQAAERKRQQRDRERHKQYTDDVTIRDGQCDTQLSQPVRQINRLTDNRLTEKISNNNLNQSNESHFWCTTEDIQKIYTDVTTYVAFPSKDREQMMEMIEKIASQKESVAATVEYLRPFFDAWKSRKGKNGRPYNPMSCAWLDWAVSGTTPGLDVSEHIATEVY